MGRETKMRLNEGDAYTDMKKWGNKMNGEEYKKGTSDNPETGENKKYIGLEDFPDTNIIGAGGEEDKESGDVFDVKEPVDVEKDPDTEEAWRGKEAVSGAEETVSSDQDLSDYDVSANSLKSTKTILVPGGNILTGENKKTPKNNFFAKGRGRQPFDKGKEGIIKKGIKKMFGKN